MVNSHDLIKSSCEKPRQLLGGNLYSKSVLHGDRNPSASCLIRECELRADRQFRCSPDRIVTFLI